MVTDHIQLPARVHYAHARIQLSVSRWTQFRQSTNGVSAATRLVPNRLVDHSLTACNNLCVVRILSLSLGHRFPIRARKSLKKKSKIISPWLGEIGIYASSPPQSTPPRPSEPADDIVLVFIIISTIYSNSHAHVRIESKIKILFAVNFFVSSTR